MHLLVAVLLLAAHVTAHAATVTVRRADAGDNGSLIHEWRYEVVPPEHFDNVTEWDCSVQPCTLGCLRTWNTGGLPPAVPTVTCELRGLAGGDQVRIVANGWSGPTPFGKFCGGCNPPGPVPCCLAIFETFAGACVGEGQGEQSGLTTSCALTVPSGPTDVNVDVSMTWRVTDDGRGAAVYSPADTPPACGRCSYFDAFPTTTTTPGSAVTTTTLAFPDETQFLSDLFDGLILGPIRTTTEWSAAGGVLLTTGDYVRAGQIVGRIYLGPQSPQSVVALVTGPNGSGPLIGKGRVKAKGPGPVTLALKLNKRGRRLLRSSTAGLDVTVELVLRRKGVRVSRLETLHFDP